MRAHLVVFLCVVYTTLTVDADEDAKAKAFLDIYNAREPQENYKNSEAAWSWATDINEENEEAKTNASIAYSLFDKEARQNASLFDVSLLSEDNARQIKMIKASATLSDPDKYKEFKQVLNDLGKYYSTGEWNGKKLDPDLVNILANSRNYDELLAAWLGWRNATGPKMRPKYKEFVRLANEGAREHGWKDNGEWWRSWYEVNDLEKMVDEFWDGLKPLYEELHAYVRFKLRKKYGADKVAEKGFIPAHLLGNMWAQSWVNIYDLVEPYAGKPSLDVTSVMKQKNYNATYMFHIAQEFFESLGLKNLPDSFWTKSMLTRPVGKDVVCHASAWDFGINKDVRIKQCTEVTQNQLVTAHHELGHIQYYLQYWDKPAVYRTGANPGFHEAVGDLMALSVNTPKHLEKIGLLKNYTSDAESDINALMKVALSKIAFLPFGFLIDQWRWKVFKGTISSDDYNAWWWYLRQKYQGIDSAVPRDENDFDPGAKYHIPANTPYIRYFMSYVFQFQFHDAACKAAGHSGDLYKCDIYQSTVAGTKIANMLSLGKSKPWPKALKELTGSENVDPSAIHNYFKPLSVWLKKQREEKNYPLGWDAPKKPGSENNAYGVVPTVFSIVMCFFISRLVSF